MFIVSGVLAILLVAVSLYTGFGVHFPVAVTGLILGLVFAAIAIFDAAKIKMTSTLPILGVILGLIASFAFIFLSQWHNLMVSPLLLTSVFITLFFSIRLLLSGLQTGG